MFFPFDFLAILFVAPAILLALYAQARVKSAFSEMSRMPARMTGAQAARVMLDRAGLHSVGIEQVAGTLSDHYDPRHKVLRLSPQVHNARSMAAVGVACHEAGHAIQDAEGYAPLVIRNAAVPVASFGSGIGVMLASLGVFMLFMQAQQIASLLLLAGIALYACVVFFQVVNLPVEFDASSRAKEQLVADGIISQVELPYVSKVLNAAALTYVAATLQSILQLLYFVFRFMQTRE